MWMHQFFKVSTTLVWELWTEIAVETFLRVEFKILYGSFSPYLAKLMVIHHGILRAINMGWVHIMIESDAFLAVQATHQSNPYSMEAPVDFVQVLSSFLSSIAPEVLIK